MMCRKSLFLLLLSFQLIYGGPAPAAQQSWTQDKGVLVHHETSQGSPFRSVPSSDSASSNSDSLLSFASAYDIQKPSLPYLASSFSDASSSVYSYTPSGDHETSAYTWTPYHNPAPLPQQHEQHQASSYVSDSYQNLPISNGIRTKLYNPPSTRTIYHGAPASAPPPTVVYGTPAPTKFYNTPTPVSDEYGTPSHSHSSSPPSGGGYESSGYGPPSHQPHQYETPEDREIRFVVHKEGDESLVKQTLSEKSKWNNEHVTFLKGPQFQIEQKQKVYLPPKPKMIVYILLKEPKVNTQVHVEGDSMDNYQKPEVFIMYERSNGVEKIHHDLAKDSKATGYNSNNVHGKRDTAQSTTISESKVVPDVLDERSSEDEPETSSSNQDNIIVKKPNVVCTATM